GQAPVRGGACAARRGGHRVPAPRPRLRPGAGADGHASASRVAAARRPARDRPDHPALRAVRRAGRPLRELREVPVSTDVAIVGFAESPCGVRTDATTGGVEMLVPIFAEVFAATGLGRSDIGFWCSGSSDYLAGRAFSFVQAVDAIGAVP